ncbi:MFS transporter [Rhizobium rhizogenes]|uniref:MFS transporter n=1 Tax=Rhizobium rhizogenes TaxID=359 RepID=UPI00129804F1|nr:MFS transporter [Rhizobium rhizogenes]MQB34205.1 MFS transporter [Rhizobium rhizogenes]
MQSGAKQDRAPERDKLFQKNNRLPWSYWTFTVGSTISNIGGMVQRVIVGWSVWELTHSAFWIGLVALVELVPTILLSPLAGALLDRVNIRRLLIYTQLVGFTQAIVLMVAIRSGYDSLILVFGMTAIFAVANAFYGPGLVAIVPRLVRRDQLKDAISMNSILANVSGLLAPMIAVQVQSLFGSGACYAINAATYLVLLLIIPLTRISEQVSASGKENYVSSIKAGYLYIAKNSSLRLYIGSFAAVSFAARSLTFLMPAITAQMFGGGPKSLGILLFATAGGAVCGGILMKLEKRYSALSVMRVSTEASALLLIGLILSPNVLFGAVVSFALGVALACNSISTQTAIQVTVQEDFNGRVMSFFQMIFRAAPAFGSFIAGTLSAVFGLQIVEIGFAVLIGICGIALHKEFSRTK